MAGYRWVVVWLQKRDDLTSADRNVFAKDLPPELMDELWVRHRAAIEPLVSSGKLGAVLFQFPPWFTARPDSYRYLEEIRGRMAAFTVAVEFRHQSWFSPSNRAATLALECDLGLVNVVATNRRV